MAISLGGSKGSSKSSMQQSVTPTNPAWEAPQQQMLATNTANLSSKDPYSFVAGAAPLQTQAATAASNLTPNTAAYNTADNTLTGQANSGSDPYAVATVHPNSILPNLSAYMDPYTNSVVNTTLASFDRNAGEQQAQAKLAMGKDDTFGGSGSSLTFSKLLSDQGLDRASTEGGLRTQAFDNGTSLANDDANRRQQAQATNAAAFNSARQFGLTQAQAAALGLISSANTQGNDARANVATQGDMGSIMQQIMQNQAQAPLTTAQQIASAYGTLPLGLLHGQDTTGSSKGKTTNFSAGYQS